MHTAQSATASAYVTYLNCADLVGTEPAEARCRWMSASTRAAAMYAAPCGLEGCDGGSDPPNNGGGGGGGGAKLNPEEGDGACARTYSHQWSSGECGCGVQSPVVKRSVWLRCAVCVHDVLIATSARAVREQLQGWIAQTLERTD